MMTKSDNAKEIKIAKIKRIIMISLGIILACIVIFYSVAPKIIANNMAEDPSKIQEGCLKFESMSINKTYANLSINNLKLTDRDGFLERVNIQGTPLRNNSGQFRLYSRDNPEICQPVKYVIVDLIIKKKVYVTQYLGDFKAVTE